MRRKLILSALLLIMSLSLFAQGRIEIEPFKLIDQYESDLTKTVFRYYEHEKTGFKVVYEENDAGLNYASFSLITPMQDEGDLNHVFEHSILSGSEKYPSSYLFFDMSQRTYITNTNASTSRGATEYYASSPSDEQLMLYIDALMSCILSPDLIRDENISERQ